jgi:hypothetical protein
MAAPKPTAQSARNGPPHNPGLRRLIEAKRKWHRPERTLPAKSGIPSASDMPCVPDSNGTQTSARSPFLGWHERGYLPHFDAPNVSQFVTFMLHDSFPVARRREWEDILNEPDDSQRRRKLEAWLDRGCGKCWLRRADVANAVEAILRAHDGKNYQLQAWTIMPNHVHLVVDVWTTPLLRAIAGAAGASCRLKPAFRHSRALNSR